MTERPATKLEDLPINPYIEWMHEQWQKDKERLWPKAPLKPRTFEQKLGEGYLTVTDNSLIFENKQGETMGFDLPNLRLVRLLDRDDFEVLYSTQGEMKKASFRVVETSANSGRELTSEYQRGRALAIIVSGGVIARFLSDHSDAQTEGIRKWTDQEFDPKLRRIQELIDQFPSHKELMNEELADDSLTNFSVRMMYHDASDELDSTALVELDQACVNGWLSPEQRLKAVAIDTKRWTRMYELGQVPHIDDDPTGSPEFYRRLAEDNIKAESILGNNRTG